MDSLHFQQACTGALIINDKNEILFVKRAENDDFFPGFWELPSGGADYGEVPQESLRREIKEECGLDVFVSYPLVVNTYFMPVDDKEVQRVEITFLCRLNNANQYIVLSREHSDYKWISKEDIKNFELSDYMRKVISDVLKNPLIASV